MIEPTCREKKGERGGWKGREGERGGWKGRERERGERGRKGGVRDGREEGNGVGRRERGGKKGERGFYNGYDCCSVRVHKPEAPMATGPKAVQQTFICCTK